MNRLLWSLSLLSLLGSYIALQQKYSITGFLVTCEGLLFQDTSGVESPGCRDSETLCTIYSFLACPAFPSVVTATRCSQLPVLTPAPPVCDTYNLARERRGAPNLTVRKVRERELSGQDPGLHNPVAGSLLAFHAAFVLFGPQVH